LSVLPTLLRLVRAYGRATLGRQWAKCGREHGVDDCHKGVGRRQSRGLRGLQLLVLQRERKTFSQSVPYAKPPLPHLPLPRTLSGHRAL
jgi:hypothetical protein